ncbi:MAG: metallophosphoesterase [Chloroflexia bacterium]|nr:metallophosphoesterase [Chloroflexia bacterium]
MIVLRTAMDCALIVKPPSAYGILDGDRQSKDIGKMPQGTPELHTPATPDRPTHIQHPADVYFNPAWRWAIAVGALLGVGLIKQQRWGLIATLGALCAAILRYAAKHEPAQPQVIDIHIHDKRIPVGFDGFTIGQISDIHLGQPYSDANLRWAVATLKILSPDLIVLTGDLVNDRPAIARLPYYLRQLHAPYGVYAITGNHDYVEGIADVMQALHFAGVPLLRNQGFVLNHNGDNIWVAGADDIWHGQMRIDHAIADAPATMPILLLAHAPDAIYEANTYPNIFLQLAGHVHGGHIRLPGLGPLVRPRYGRWFTHGTQRVQHTWLHISLGLSGRPLRLGNPPEVGLIHLHATTED